MKPYYQDDFVTLYHADALDLLRSLAGASVALIATDPPYFRVKDEPWDNAWDSPSGFLSWVDTLCVEFRRVLRPNGSLYFFASPQMGHAVEGVIRNHFSVLTNIRWRKPPFATKAEMFDKEELRAPFPASETILFAEHLDSVYGDETDVLLKQTSAPLAQYFRLERERAGVSRREIAKALAFRGIYKNEQTGAAMCSDWEYGDSLPPEAAYHCLREVLNAAGGRYLTRGYVEIAEEFTALRNRFREARRPYFASPERPYTDVWDFDTVNTYPGKHPCEKPIALCEHIIRTSSRPSDLILDPFCGSGRMLQAARNLGRQAIGGDASSHWCSRSADDLSQQILFGDVA